jgi:hypothetical protein
VLAAGRAGLQKTEGGMSEYWGGPAYGSMSSDGVGENQPEQRTGPHRTSGETNSGATGDSELTRSARQPSDTHCSAGTDHAKVADWLEDQARIATNSLHCGDNSAMIQQTHDWADKLEAAARHLRAAPQEALNPEQIEAGAKAIYESKLLVQPREPWGGQNSVTTTFCKQAAESCLRAALSLPRPHGVPHD